MQKHVNKMQPENATLKTLAQENASKNASKNAKTMQLLEICFCKACTFPEFAFLSHVFCIFFAFCLHFFCILPRFLAIFEKF